MSANVIPFVYNDKPVRTVDQNGDPWFAGKDICGVLDIRDHRQALDRLDSDERGRCSIPTPMGEQEMIIISEAGVYRLVFSSRKAEAEAFKRWLAHEVLPQLRKTGKFAVRAPEAEPMGDEPTQRLNAKVGLINAAARLFGPERAKKLWSEIGLPPVPALEIVREEDQARACLAHLLDHEMPTGSSARDVILSAFTSRALCKQIEACGLALHFQPDGVLVSNTSDYIEGLFRYTEFEGHWRGLLRSLPGVVPDSGRFAGVQSRATFLPMRLIASKVVQAA